MSLPIAFQIWLSTAQAQAVDQNRREKTAMSTANEIDSNKKQFGLATRALGGFCHRCGICPWANKVPNSPLGKTMRWHRTWCPGWASHKKIHGPKSL